MFPFPCGAAVSTWGEWKRLLVVHYHQASVSMSQTLRWLPLIFTTKSHIHDFRAIGRDTGHCCGFQMDLVWSHDRFTSALKLIRGYDLMRVSFRWLGPWSSFLGRQEVEQREQSLQPTVCLQSVVSLASWCSWCQNNRQCESPSTGLG